MCKSRYSPPRTFLVQILKRVPLPVPFHGTCWPKYLTEKKWCRESYLRTMRTVRECRGRRAGSGSRNEPSWETGERGSDVVVLFATAADSRYQKRGKESKRASARATRRPPSRSTASPRTHLRPLRRSLISVAVEYETLTIGQQVPVTSARNRRLECL